MFDFFCIISIGNIAGFGYPKKNSSYSYLKDIPFCEENLSGRNFSFSLLRHSDQDVPCKFQQNNIHIFIMGEIYSNGRFKQEYSGTKQLYPKDIFHLYEKEGASLANFIKGIYILLIFNENLNEYYIFTSRSGLLDSYYYMGENCLFISSSLENIVRNPLCKTDIDQVALIQQHIYDYPLGNRTLFENISIINPASVLEYDLFKIKIQTYFNYENALKNIGSITWEDTKELSPGIFNSTLDLISNDQKRICSALTSGFDSRANLSRLLNLSKDVLFYSWGMSESTELKVPLKISKKLHFNYKPILLGHDFEEKYDYYAKQAVLWSDGRATIRRANHSYSYSILSKYSRFNLTGLMGSELIRPTNAVDHIFNQEFIDSFYSDKPLDEIKMHFLNFSKRKILKDTILIGNEDRFINETANYFKNFISVGEKYKQLYYFALTEGFRKYFGHEIHGNRIYNSIQSPYIDDDFVDFLLRTPIPFLNINAFKRDSRTLRLGQLFYIPILKHNCPPLLEIRTGRYYKPSSLTSPLYPFSILTGLVLKKFKQKIKGNDTFNITRWNKIFIKENQNLISFNTDFFNPLSDEVLLSIRDIDLSKIISIRFWMNELLERKR
jgi:hypothetical protein